MTIRAFSQRSRLTQRALRLYGESGLLEPAFVDEQTGYRYYIEAQLETARQIVLLRQLEMPLNQIAEVLKLDAAQRLTAIETFWTEAEAQVTQRRKLMGYLRGRMRGEAQGHFAVQTRAVPAQKVLALGRELTRPELGQFIQSGFAALFTHLARSGVQPAGAPLVIYHWELDFDSPGFVEVCVPFDGHLEPAPNLAVRLEPPHREAFVRLTKAQVEYPDLLHAYDSLTDWLHVRSLIYTAPREIYFAPWDATPPDQPAFDVAFVYQQEE